MHYHQTLDRILRDHQWYDSLPLVFREPEARMSHLFAFEPLWHYNHFFVRLAARQ